MREFRDPIHGFIKVSDNEKRIIDSAPFQRLRNIKQLALTCYVYHGAEHTRFGHSLGVMHLSSRAFNSAASKGDYKFKADPVENDRHIKWLEQILRLIALTHDLGHAPFSHAAEDLFPFKNTNKKERYKHEDLTELIVKAEPIAGIIRDIGREYKSKDAPDDDYDITPEMICDIYNGKIPGANSEFTLLRTFIDSELDCDKMDYLLRDSLYCGVSYGKFDLERLISSLVIAGRPHEAAPILCIDSGGINAFEEFVLARYFMFIQVYFHKTRRFFDIMLSMALKQCLPEGLFTVNAEEYLQWDDTRVMELLKSKADQCKEAERIIKRQRWVCVNHTKTHPNGDSLKYFRSIERRLKKKFGEEKFLVDRSADKIPHKLVPRKYEIDSEEIILIMNKKQNRFTTISDESQIISNLTDKINIQRIYAREDISDAALSEVREDTED
ncbi:MAG: HD domain-containing protein [Clostridiales bacterium]|nr:HD domain-containing protein [Clostridiales bacterium]